MIIELIVLLSIRRSLVCRHEVTFIEESSDALVSFISTNPSKWVWFKFIFHRNPFARIMFIVCFLDAMLNVCLRVLMR